MVAEKAERWRAGDIHGKARATVLDVYTGHAIGVAYAPYSSRAGDRKAERNRRARLFAAAPEMLEALEMVADDESLSVSQVLIIRAAIAAAKVQERHCFECGGRTVDRSRNSLSCVCKEPRL